MVRQRLQKKNFGAKKPKQNSDVIIDNIVISKLIKTNNLENLTGYLDEATWPLFLMLPKISGYVKTFRDKSKDKNKDNKLMSFCIDKDKLLQKYKTIWTRIEDLQNVELNALSVYDDRYVKTKIRSYGDEVYFRGLNVPEDGAECQSFSIISIDPLLLFMRINTY